MRIERQDKQPESREREIQENWRIWAKLNKFIQKDPLLVEAGKLAISLEIWKSPGHAGLIYLPQLLGLEGGDVLYIADNLDEMLEIVNKLVLGVLVMIQVKQGQKEERARLN